MKLLPMTTDPAGSWALHRKRPEAPSQPGEWVRIESSFGGPKVFTGLRVGPDTRIWVLGQDGPVRASVVARWRIDEVRIDDVVAPDVAAALKAAPEGDGLLVYVHGDFGVGSNVSIRATNIGDRPSYFYATWELEDLQ